MGKNASSPPSSGRRPPSGAGLGRWRLVLLASLAVLLAVYPLIHSRIADWRRRNAPSEAVPGQAVPGQAVPSEDAANQAVQEDAAAAAAGTASATVAAPHGRAGESPETRAQWIARLREEVVQMARTTVAEHPGQVEAVALLATAYTRFGETDEAEQCWRDCLALDGQFAQAHARLGAIQLERGQYEAAAADFQEALKQNPRLPDVRPQLADALMNLARMGEAAETLQEQVRRFPDSTEGYFRLGQAYYQQEDFQRAAESYRQSIRLDPRCTYAYYGLANSCRQLAQPAQASAHMETFKRLKQEDLASERERSGRFDDAAAVRQSAATLYVSAGNLAAQRGDFARAEAHWLRAAELDSQDLPSRSQLVRLYEQQKRVPEMLGLLEAIRSADPHNPAHYLNLGAAQLRYRDWSTAENAYRQALELAPDNGLVHAAVADFYLRTGRNLAEARRLAVKAAELQPSASHFALVCALCQRLDDLAAALQAIESALALDADNTQFRQVRSKLKSMLDARAVKR